MSNFMAKASTAVKKTAGNAQLTLKKNSPEILLAAGIIFGVATVILACKETLKAEEIVDKHKEMIDTVHEAAEIAANDENVEFDEKQGVMGAYMKTAWSFAKLYAPAIAMGAISITCVLASHSVLKRRYLGVVAAYEALDTAFKAYRGRVAEEFGDEVEERIRKGVKKEEIEVTDDKGKTKKQEVDIVGADGKAFSPYARFFDESAPEWKKDPELNLVYLRTVQQMMTDKLRARGHLFLNEVYDALGIPRSKAGAVVGWKLGMGDDYVDFGLYSGYDRSRDFVNGYERSILLDFNVAGVIYDQL